MGTNRKFKINVGFIRDSIFEWRHTSVAGHETIVFQKIRIVTYKVMFALRPLNFSVVRLGILAFKIRLETIKISVFCGD